MATRVGNALCRMGLGLRAVWQPRSVVPLLGLNETEFSAFPMFRLSARWSGFALVLRTLPMVSHRAPARVLSPLATSVFTGALCLS